MRLWQFTSDFAIAERVMDLSRQDGTATIVVRNQDVLFEYDTDIRWPLVSATLPGEQARLKTLPPPTELLFTEPDFAPDLFDIGFEFVSARARAAMALSDDDVQWLPVDASGSTATIIAQDYRVMHIVQSADPFDHDRSDGSWEEMPGPGGQTARRWMLRRGGYGQAPARIAWRQDFVPPAPVFRATPVQFNLATEDLAARVAAAGIDDIVFFGLENDGTRTDFDFRSAPPPSA